MTPLVGDTLASRAARAFLAAFALFALAVVILASWPLRDQPGAGPFQLPVPDEAAAIVAAVEASPPVARPAVLRALSSSSASVSVRDEPPPLASELRRSPELEWAFAQYSHALTGRPFRVELRRGGFWRALALWRTQDEAPAVRLVVGLRTGGVLVLERRPPAYLRSYVARIAALAGVGTLILLAGLVLAMRQTAEPVRRLADAARRFSLDQAAPDLPERGPREVRDLAAAFNDMQGRIRALVDDRTRVLAAIAHDLRTYLTRLRLRAEFIADDEQRARAERDIEDMAALIDDTLLFARQAAGAHADAPVADVDRVLAALMETRRELGQAVTLASAAPAGCAVTCSERALRRMADNLVDNAVRYGSLARVTVAVDGDRLRLVVEDDGPGVAADLLPRLAQPFVRAEPSRARETGGAGLGLAIVRGLAESAGGELQLANGQAGGLLAILILPLSPSQDL
jgi:two-component system osmolarity sensor histidine kinase EnvZ